MRESRTYGSVRGALSNERPYRDRRSAPRKDDSTLSISFHPALAPLDFGLLLQAQDMRAQAIEPLFRGVAEQRIPVIGHCGGDLRPIPRLQRLQRRGKELMVFHHDVVPLALDEVANDG